MKPLRTIILIASLTLAPSFLLPLSAQETKRVHTTDTITTETHTPEADTLTIDTTRLLAIPGKIIKQQRYGRDLSGFKPDPIRSTWLALVLPGAGQIYNRKYWKLPLVYGGFVGCIYALQWNGQMYSDYAQAYQDIMDDDPETKSYEDFLHLGAVINDTNLERYKTIFKSRKDRYRRWRDLSMFCLIGVYGLSIIDAYVDASLSQFDISDDLSMKVTPAYINNNSKNMMASRNAFENSGLGIRCRLNF